MSGASDAAPYDFVVIGAGPAGQKAAIQAAKAGKRVIVIEQERGVGGACVRHGTIPSKTLRESALALAAGDLGADVVDVRMRENVEVAHLMRRLDDVVQAHGRYMARQIERNGIELVHGRARFTSSHEVEMRTPSGARRALRAATLVIATGSRPRAPKDVPVDHEHVLDSDSILSMIYLPRSLTVLGGGVIASEYASIFALLGVRVTMIDKADRPLAFLDREITTGFLEAFRAQGGTFLGGAAVTSVEWDGLRSVVTTLGDGTVIESDKALVALGRLGNVESLDLAAAGLAPNARGLLDVDERCRTSVSHIYAVGDVIGPPALAASAMEQGRRAVCDALGIDPGQSPEMIPIGIYAVPEIASVGIDEAEATKRHGDVIVGRARFAEVARGQISDCTDGLLKLVADGSGRRLLGAQIVGQGATELIHVAQMALIAGFEVDAFVENVFNFPTLAEAYRVAALDIAAQRKLRVTAAHAAVAPACAAGLGAH